MDKDEILFKVISDTPVSCSNKWDYLNRKICKAFVTGKFPFDKYSDKHNFKERLERTLAVSLQLEEYEASRVIQNEIDKLNEK
jgi:hypothetical protein